MFSNSWKIISVTEAEDPLFKQGIVSFEGIKKNVNLSLIPEAEVGQYVLVHVGVAISTVDEEEAQKLFAQLKAMEELAD